ncbi:hypothetical protein PQR46_20400 [Paraburkholderia sediminicola]|uniref:hypothetical protein n=1 Tax=Paraburkholderia sediminicola TaxID=458836 RepID=UPI0038B9C2BF
MSGLSAYRIGLPHHFIPWTGTPGASQEATKVDQDVYLVNERLAESWSVKDELLSLAAESGEVSNETLSKAYQFALALPADIVEPELSVDPDGEVAFDWAEAGNILSISVGGAGRITYAGKFENDRTSGTAYLVGQFPVSLDDGLKKFRK